MPSAAARGREFAARMLVEAEQWATLASLVGGRYPYAAFEHVHRLLPRRRASARASQAYELSREIRDRSLAHLCSHIRTAGEGRPLVVFNGQSWPRSDVVSLRVTWPEPGVTAVSVLDMWDRRVPAGVENVLRHAEGSIAEATLLFEALEVPSVGYRTYRLIGQPWGDLVSDFHAAVTAARPLIGVVTDGHRGHLPPASGLVQIDPVHDVELISLARNADGAVVLRVREMTGKPCRAEIRMFVQIIGDPLRVDLRPRQTATITATAERAPWAPDGPSLAPKSMDDS